MKKRSFRPQATAGGKTPTAPVSAMTIEGYLKRAQGFAKMQDYSQAIFELRQAIKAYPNSALCHSTLSVLYFEADQQTMAGVHAKRTLVLDPTNQLAMKIQQTLMKHKSKSAKHQPAPATSQKNGIMGLLTKKMF
ncbi:MAG: hypothetical protein AAGA83_26130 [Cyanobacteria bacterium P01_F01_bin.116]